MNALGMAQGIGDGDACAVESHFRCRFGELGRLGVIVSAGCNGEKQHGRPSDSARIAVVGG